MTDYHEVKTRCPECGSIENIKVDNLRPFYANLHICINCGYVITEDEWEEVEPKDEEK